MRFISWIPRVFAFLLNIIPFLAVLLVVVLLSAVLYVAIPIYIIGVWLTFIADGKWNFWWSRAGFEALRIHDQISAIWKGLF